MNKSQARNLSTQVNSNSIANLVLYSCLRMRNITTNVHQMKNDESICLRKTLNGLLFYQLANKWLSMCFQHRSHIWSHENIMWHPLSCSYIYTHVLNSMIHVKCFWKSITVIQKNVKGMNWYCLKSTHHMNLLMIKIKKKRKKNTEKKTRRSKLTENNCAEWRGKTHTQIRMERTDKDENCKPRWNCVVSIHDCRN